MTESSGPIIVEQTFEVTRRTLWQAVTDLDQMIHWFFGNIPDFEPKVGFETQFDVDAGERNFLHVWRILEVVPEQKITYDWRYEGYPGAGKVVFELFDQGAGSGLRVTSEGMDSFPADVPEFSRENCLGGWKYFVQGNLKRYLESGAE